MIVFLTPVAGGIVGLMVGLICLGVDMVLGTSMITERRFSGIVLICAAASPLAAGLVTAICFWRENQS